MFAGWKSLFLSPLDVTREIQHWTVLHLQHVLRVSSGLVFVGGACSRSRLLAGFHRIVPYAGLRQSIRAWAEFTESEIRHQDVVEFVLEQRRARVAPTTPAESN